MPARETVWTSIERHREGVRGTAAWTVLGINSNRQDSITELASYVRRHGIEYPMLKDVGNRVGRPVLTRSALPEVFVLDSDRVVPFIAAASMTSTAWDTCETNRKRMNSDRPWMSLLAGRKVSVSVTAARGMHNRPVFRESRANSAVTYSNQIFAVAAETLRRLPPRERDRAVSRSRGMTRSPAWAEMIREVVS